MERKKIGIGIFLVISVFIIYYLSANYFRNHAKIVLYGNVDIREVDLAFRVGGRLTELLVDEGDTVHKGQLVARLDSEPYEREVQATEATIEQQKALVAYADSVFIREKKLLGTGASTTDRYQNAFSSLNASRANLQKAIAENANAKLRLADTYLYSPSDGVVLTRVIEPGSMVSANATIVTVSLITPVWIRAYIDESKLGKAKPGVAVKVFADSYPKKSYEGKIGFVSSTAEFTPKTVETTNLRTDLVYRLRIIVQDPQHELRQGMPVTVQLQES